MDTVSQTDTNHTTPNRLDFSRGRRTYQPDIPTSHPGEYPSDIAHLRFATQHTNHFIALLLSPLILNY